MNLSSEQSHDRVAANEHGVLATLHAARGADLVPVVYTVVDGHVGVPVDLVKPKASTRLQRERNLAADPRATLLIEHWDRDDWSALWWVRTRLHWLGAGMTESAAASELAERMADRLAERHTQDRDFPFVRVLVFRIEGMTGWSAER